MMSAQQPLTRSALKRIFLSNVGQEELVGIEVENGLVDSGTGCSVSYEGNRGTCKLLDTLVRQMNGRPLTANGYLVGVELPNGANLTLETGGALEYASLPSVGLVKAVQTAHADLLQVSSIADQSGVALLSGACLPFTPKNKIPWTPKPRVKVMRDYFNGLGEPGKHAEEVMGLTLSTQTSLDYLSEQDFVDKLRLHVLAAPIVAALFVNSPITHGTRSGVLSSRMQYWCHFDPRRCGVLSFAVESNTSVDDFIDWTVGLPMIYRDVDGVHVAASDKPFLELMRTGFGDGTWPTYEDWQLHLCQLWPHVRPRQTLELRASDGLPWPSFSAAPAIWVGLTYNDGIRKEASSFLSDISALDLRHSIDQIPVNGLDASVGRYQVKELAVELVRLARRGLEYRVDAGIDPEEVVAYLEPIEEVVETQRTFADMSTLSWQHELGQSAEKYVNKYRIPFDTVG
jgi:glutamate--cysteine ligase